MVIPIVPPSAVSDCVDRLLARPLPPPNRRGSVPGVPVGPGEHRIVFRASAVHPGTSTDASLVRLVAGSSDCGLNVSCRSDLASRRPPAPAPSPSQPNRPLTRRTRFGFLDSEARRASTIFILVRAAAANPNGLDELGRHRDGPAAVSSVRAVFLRGLTCRSISSRSPLSPAAGAA